MSSFTGGPLTEEEEYLLERFKILREKKKLLQKLKEKAETKVKPAVKREFVPTVSITPEDAKKKAEMLVASGCVKISKTSASREFKRARTSEKKAAKDNLSDQESTTQLDRRQSQSDIAAMKELYHNNFVKSGEGRDNDSNGGYDHREHHRGFREPRKGNTIFIKGYGLTEEIVRNEFHKFGTVTDVRFERDRRFGFVTYKTPEEAEKAVTEMNGARVANVNVHVSYARRQYHNDRGDTPMWSRSDSRPRDRRDEPQVKRELQKYGDEDDFF